MSLTEILFAIAIALLSIYILWGLLTFDFPFFWSIGIGKDRERVRRLLMRLGEKRRRARLGKEQEARINHLKQRNMDKELIKENLSKAEDLLAQALGEYNVATASRDENYPIYREIFSIYERLSKLNSKLTKEL